MPGIFYEPISRKSFLATAAKAAGAIALTPIADRVLGAEEASKSLRVALLSDTHIPADPTNEYRGFHPVENLINLPAVGYNFADSEPVGWVDASFSRRGVDLTLHAIGGNQKGHGQTTSVVWA